MSINACFWNSELAELVGTYPLLTAWVLTARFYMVLAVTVMCALSDSRLLLFIKPVLVNSVHPNTRVTVVGFTVIIICIPDITNSWKHCAENDAIHDEMLMVIFKAEMGIKKLQINHTEENECPHASAESMTNQPLCFVFPMILV